MNSAAAHEVTRSPRTDLMFRQHLRAALEEWDDGHISAAIAHIKEAHALIPENLETIINLAAAHAYNGNFKQARAFIIKAHRLEPNNHQKSRLLGCIATDLGQDTIAEAAFHDSVHFAPTIWSISAGLDGLERLLRLRGQRTDAEVIMRQKDPDFRHTVCPDIPTPRGERGQETYRKFLNLRP